jgi:hypothetical protein
LIFGHSRACHGGLCAEMKGLPIILDWMLEVALASWFSAGPALAEGVTHDVVLTSRRALRASVSYADHVQAVDDHGDGDGC